MVPLSALPESVAPPRTVPFGPGGGHRAARVFPDLILLDIPCGTPQPPGSPTLLIDGRPLPPPTAACLIGSQRTPRLLFVARDRDGLLRPDAECILRRGDQSVACFLPGPPIEPGALFDADRGDGMALLRFLVRTAAPALRATGPDAGLAVACHALARRWPCEPGRAARPLCRPGATLSLWALPDAPAGDWHLLDRDAIRRVAPIGRQLVLDSPPPSRGALLLPPGPDAVPIGFAPVPASLPTLRDLLSRHDPPDGEPRPRALAALAQHARQNARSAAVLREAQLLAPAAPRRVTDPVSPVGAAIELALSDGAGGLFLRGWVRDPLGLVAGLELHSGLAHRPVPPAALHRVARPDLAEEFSRAAFGGDGPHPGFLAHLPDADHPAVAQWRLALRLASGEAIEVTAPPARLAPATGRDLVLRAVHPTALSPGLLADCIAPAAVRLHRAALSSGGTPEVIRIGTPPRRPCAALVVPLYRNLRFLRFQLAAFARDAVIRDGAELVFVLDSPEQRAQVEHLLRGMAMLHAGLPLVLVVMPENRGYASACNAGAAASSAPVLGFLNSDVLPADRGWLPALLGRLRRDRRLAAVGPRLLFDDGSLQHAGLLFRRGADGQWFNDHYFKGFPRHYPAACVPRRVPAVTGAALFVRRAAFEATGGFSTDYIIGDFEDSDLCLALRAAGHEIGYEPSAELFHFERQSIADHAGHAGSLAGACNRLLHHRRWDGAIAALMTRFRDEG